MEGSGSGGGELFGRFTDQALLVLDRAREEAERAGHRYLGPEHVLLGVLAEGQSEAARVLRARWGGPGGGPGCACSPGRSGSGAGAAAQ